MEPKTKNRTADAQRRRLKRLIRQITDELFTINVGNLNEARGDRLAVMAGKWPDKEIHLGGRNRASVQELLTDHLANAKLTNGGCVK